MKKLALAAAILLAGSVTAHAQRQGGEGRPGDQSGQRTKGGSSQPAPAPVIVKKVFVPVVVPSVPTWNKSEHRYSERRHGMCQEKAHRLHSYERHAADDGYLSGRERRNIDALKRDLATSCGGHRWRG
jgi:hypothetical protein